MDLPFEVVHQFKVEPVKAELFGIKTTRNWKRYAKECKTQKKAQARQEHLQRWERIRRSQFSDEGAKTLARIWPETFLVGPTTVEIDVWLVDHRDSVSTRDFCVKQ